jgi:intracellular multiplication protein IcmE
MMNNMQDDQDKLDELGGDDVPLDFDDDLDMGDEFGDDLGLDADFETGGGAIPSAMKDNPMMKVGIVAGALAVIVGGIVLFGGDKEQQNMSRVTGAADVSQAPATDTVSESYRQAIEERNIQQRETALREGGSAIPEPISTMESRVTLDENEAAEEDPLARWRRLQEERQQQAVQQQQIQQRQQPQFNQPNPQVDIVNNLAAAMAEQMSSILEGIQPVSPQHVQVTAPNHPNAVSGAMGGGFQQAATQQMQGGQFAGMPGQQQQAAAPQVVDILIPAGTIEYAQLITEANTDAPGPVLAQIVSGPLAGSRMLGSFDEQQEYLTLDFTTIVVEGISYGIDAVALDPKTTRPGLVTEIDRRYFSRIVLPAAASFLEGLGEGIANAGSTSVSVNGENVASEEEDLDVREELFKGVEKAAQEAGDIFERDSSQVRQMIRVAAGTPMAILFMQPVSKQ